MKNDKVRKLVLCALFVALVCVATLVIKIPLAIGYINLGDSLVLLSSFFLGPLYGGIASGIGSAFADMLCGYVAYAPGTFFIKLIMGFVSGHIFQYFKTKKLYLALIVSALVCEIIMVVGYLIYEMFVLSYGSAAYASILFNLIQGVVSAIIGIILYRVLYKKVG